MGGVNQGLSVEKISLFHIRETLEGVSVEHLKWKGNLNHLHSKVLSFPISTSTRFYVFLY